ncbi:taurine ABC transporter substrate-binding protein [Desulfohalovibrio reitneri]|uniref:taurine ABC transporter substrate-binding protein n=1 Tax=Desulfohalovibrio reitneri TaxID=1307759 RepID=UPI000AD3A072|nr:taurine ABC transporter substrate-binding protein [Desulfohalovibrio reitneri]
MRRLLVLCALLLLVAAPAAAAEKSATIGYQLIFNPWKIAMAEGWFEEATGWELDFRQFDSGSKVLPALASGDVDIALGGSTPVATATSSGLPVELFWINEAIEGAEALVVRDGSGIVAPQDLRGKTIGVPFVSTTHFHTLFALEQFGIPESEVRLLNLQPNAITAAWKRGDIDAAFVWSPALDRIMENGKVLITSGQLGDWGKPTFDGLMARTDFSRENPEFMVEFVKVLARTSALYRDNPEAFTPDSKEVKAIVSMVGGNAGDVPTVLSRYGFPSLEEQVSCQWLGCGEDGGAARALTATAKFLKSQKKIPQVAESYAKFVNPEWAERALQER